MNREDDAYKYLTIERHLRERIERGAYAKGQPIESESELSRQFGQTRATVRHALTRLAQQGLIERSQGKRSYPAEARPLYRGRRHDRVGFVTYDPGYFDMVDLRESVRRALGAAGYDIETRYVIESIAQERVVLSELIEMPLDGLIIEGVGTGVPSFNMDLYDRFHEMRIPIVFTNGYHDGVHAAHVVAGDRDVMHKMVDYLASLGHRRIGAVFARDQYQGLARYRGYLDGLKANGLEYLDNSVMFVSFGDRRFIFDNLFNAYRESLLSCTALVCYSDSYADFLEATLLRNGVAVPDGMSVTGMDNMDIPRMSRLKLTTATLPLAEMGARAAETLIRMIDTRCDAPSTTLTCELVVGDSTRPPL